MVYSCDKCGKSYASHYNLKRHTANLHIDLRVEESTERHLSEAVMSEEEMTESDEEMTNSEAEEQPLAPFWEKLKGRAIKRYGPRIKRLSKEYEGDGYYSARSYKEAYIELLPGIRTAVNEQLRDSIYNHEQFSADPIIEQITEA